MSTEQQLPTKAPTGITGFDEITGRGLPLGRPTLLVANRLPAAIPWRN